MADEVQLDELRADLNQLAASAPKVVDALNLAIDKLVLARDAIEELGRGCGQVAERTIQISATTDPVKPV